MQDNIALFQNHRSWFQIKDQVFDLVNQMHNKGQAQNSTLCQDLETRLATMYGRRHCVTVACCTDALVIALELLDLPPGSAVAVPNYTFTATAHAIARAGHRVIPIDVTNDYCVAVDSVHDVAALVNVDLFGNMADWQRLSTLAIPIINDAAQSMESRDHTGWSVGKGQISCVSFSPSKPISSWGSGGALFLDDDDLAKRARKIRLHGKARNNAEAISPGMNSMMSTMEVASVWAGLDHAHSWRQRREHIATHLISCSAYPTANNLKQPQHSFSKLVFRSQDRASTQQRLRQHGIDCAIHYEKLINDENLYHGNWTLPVSDWLKSQSFTVPNQHTLTDPEVERIAKALE